MSERACVISPPIPRAGDGDGGRCGPGAHWGGFVDHVPPPAAPLTALDPQIGNTDGLRGFRIPVVLVSPLAKRGHVSHRVFDHTSVLRTVEWRWHLDPLSVGKPDGARYSESAEAAVRFLAGRAPTASSEREA